VCRVAEKELLHTALSGSRKNCSFVVHAANVSTANTEATGPSKPASAVEKVEFPREVAGFLIGKKGASVRGVSKKAKVKIDSRDEGKKRIFTVKPNRSGDSEAVKLALSIMTEASQAYQDILSGDSTPGTGPKNDDGMDEIVVQGVKFAYTQPNQRRRQGGGNFRNSRNDGGGGNFNNDNRGGNNSRGGGNFNNNRNGFRGGNQNNRRGGGKKNVIEKRRTARAQRKETRPSKVSVRERQEIFEVPEEGMAISELAEELAVDPTEIVKVLFLNGKMASVNQTIDADSVTLVAEHYGVEVLEKEGDDSVVRMTFDEDDDIKDAGDLKVRPPVVAIMGHVDHGKTSLLDFLRKSQVAEGEAGGITQSIGAYSIQAKAEEAESQWITFLDTPGHEAFSAMRARGASVTDIAVLVVAADDGVKPQTKEALKQAQSAGVPIIVAITKMDVGGAQVERVKQELSQVNLLPEDWGGETVIVPLSSKTGEGVDTLLDSILLLSDVHEYTGVQNVPARGTILEANMDKSCGPVASCIVQAGSLKIGDVVTAGTGYGKVKSMIDASGEQQTEVGPSFAVQMVGLDNVPSAGDAFQVVEDEQKAREMAEKACDKERQLRLNEQSSGSFFSVSSMGSFDDFGGDGNELKILNVILRASASGSLEAIKGSLRELPQEKVMLRYLTSATGEITQSDIDLASTSEAFIIGFDLTPSEEVMAYAKQQEVEMTYSDIIYNLINDVEKVMVDLLEEVEVLDQIGEAEVLAVFGSNNSKVAGCKVTEGVVQSKSRVKVTRKKKTVFEGDISSLRIVKENVSEVTEGSECGLGCDEYDGWKAGDKVVAYSISRQSPTLE
jgi:translation initiation factor IF-2